MKRCTAILTWLIFIAASGAAETASVVERGLHHRKWVTQRDVTRPGGQTVQVTNTYTELAVGMHYVENGQLLESEDLIEPVAGGAQAVRGPAKAVFSRELNTRGAIAVMIGNSWLRCHVIGLAYTDPVTGQSVLVAEVKNSIGGLVGRNQVLWPDAFDGCVAHVRYTYSRGSIEQDVVVSQPPAPPEAYGLSRDCRLEVITEFIEAPDPAIAESSLPVRPRRDGRAAAPFVDQELDFGLMRMSQGRAFVDGNENALEEGVLTGKSWIRHEGRTFLIEAVQYEDVSPLFAQLGEPSKKRDVAVGPQRKYPAGPLARAPESGPMRQFAALKPQTGVVLDWVLTGGITNHVFQRDSTTVVMGIANLYGLTTVEGGSVIKYTNGARVQLHGLLDCQTDAFNPAVFTSIHDDSVGATISGSSGDSSKVSGYMLAFYNTATKQYYLHDLRFLYGSFAVYGTANNYASITNCQFIHCSYPLRNSSADWTVRNVLVQNAANVFSGAPNRISAEHVTVDGAIQLVDGTIAVALTNSLLVGVTNSVLFSGVCVATNASSAGIFQTNGNGRHYLATNSPYRDAGTTNINPDLLAALRKRTTYPPQRLTGPITSNTVLAPSVPRDSGAPDLGYAYDPLDYLINGLVVSNATLVLTNGVAIGIDYATSGWGFVFKDAQLTSIGSHLALNRIVRSHMVQEGSSGNDWNRALFYDGDSTGNTNALRLRFTYLSQLADDGYMLLSGQKFAAIEWSHCWLFGPSIVVDSTDNALVCGATNTVFERGGGMFGYPTSANSLNAHLQNVLLRDGFWHFLSPKASWVANDNLFERSTLHEYSGAVANSNNAYFLTTNVLSGGSSNLTLTNLTYENGPLGPFYLPTNSVLLDGGSTLANAVALYHFTSTKNQVKETNSTVNIGLHFVTLNSAGNPLDSDNDGLSDYLEDVDGDGVADPGELSWLNADSDGDGVGDGLELLQGRNPFGGTIADTNNLLNLRVYTPLK